MIMARGFMAPSNLQSLLVSKAERNTITFSFLFPHKTHKKPHFNILSNSSSFLKERDALCAFALKKRKSAKESVIEVDDFEDELDFDDEDGDGDDIGIEDGDNEDDGDEGFLLPIENMRTWLENKPLGFGEGKAYDTTIEDKLFEEIEQSKAAQLVNINKLKNNPVEVISKEKQQKLQKAPEVIPSGVCVRLSNLPKKKNIHKNLKAAFKETPGILKIAPAVSGNEKTRDPVCKGLAFVYLRSDQDANRFIEIFSKQSIAFGKIEKHINCEIVNPPSNLEESTVMKPVTPKSRLPRKEEIPIPADSFRSNSSSNISIEESDDELITAEWEESEEKLESVSKPELNKDEIVKPKLNSTVDLLSSTTEKKKTSPAVKKQVDKRKGGKVATKPTLGAAKRLKMKEKALLTGVLSKYAEHTVSASRKG